MANIIKALLDKQNGREGKNCLTFRRRPIKFNLGRDKTKPLIFRCFAERIADAGPRRG
jgi:hypothetical protein